MNASTSLHVHYEKLISEIYSFVFTTAIACSRLLVGSTRADLLKLPVGVPQDHFLFAVYYVTRSSGLIARSRRTF